jgi:peptide chain release factor 1
MLHPAVRAMLEAEAQRALELQELLTREDVARDPARLRGLLLEMGRLEKRVRRFDELRRHEREAASATALAESEPDAEMKALAAEEAAAATARVATLGDELQDELLARHRFSDRNIILEVRAGTGGDEASLFAADLARMYQRYAERHGFKFEELAGSRSDVGGWRELTASIEGEAVYDAMRFESGVHRVQRVPATEAQGRIHTSTATVAVLPEPEEVEVEIRETDLKIDTFRAGGPGGQAVNKTSSAIRVTHVPSGLVVICQDERSQSRNRSKALRTLRSRLFELQEQRTQSERATDRREQIGTGERSEKIRTYNFPQDRVTDHRVKESFHPITAILDGDLDEIVAALRKHETEERLRALARPGGDRPE